MDVVYLKLIVAILIALPISDVCAGTADSKYVRIGVDAKWPQTSFILEASEFMASIDKEKFWKYIEILNITDSHKNNLDSYRNVLSSGGSILSSLEVDMMRFALSTRSFSPKLEVYRQIIKEAELPDCDTIFNFRSKYFCEVDALEKELSNSDGEETQVKYFDHIYPESESNTAVVILYALAGTNSFHLAHNKMKQLVKNKNVKYILRHLVKGSMLGNVHLSGYGVELAIKSTEYKAQDDQKVQGKDDSKTGGRQQDDDDEVDGFLFGKLRDLHPDLTSDLQSFRTHLKESNKELAELKVWQLQDLSFQAAQRVMSSTLDQRLKVLRDISQNLPMLTKSLVKTSVKDDLKNEVKKNQEKFKQSNIEAGEAALFINGMQIQIDSLDAFNLQSLLLKEMDTLKELDALELEGDKASEVVALDVKPPHSSYAVDIRSESVQWLNDLEKDRQYAYWPSNLEEILRPTFPGMLRYIAKNIFHVVVCVNPTEQKSINLFKMMQDFVSNSMPARFGVLFVADGSPDDDGVLEAGLGMTRAFSFIKAEKGLKEAFDFVTEVYKRTDQRVPAPTDVTNLFKRWYGEDDMKDALSPNTDYDDLRRNSYQLFERLGLKSLPQAFINGLQLSQDEVDSIENALIDRIMTITPSIQQATYTGQIFSQPTIYDYVMSQENVVKRLNPIIQTIEGPYISTSAPLQTTATQYDVSEIEGLTKEQALNALSSNLKYFLNEKGIVTTWIVADADTVSGRELIRSALQFIIKNSKTSRLALILCPSSAVDKEASMNHVINGIIASREKMISGVAKFLLKVLNETNDFEEMVRKPSIVVEMSTGAVGFNKKKLMEMLTGDEAKKSTNKLLLMNRAVMSKSIGYKNGEAYVICNGRVIGALDDSKAFTHDDFELLQSFENDRSASKINKIVQNMAFTNMPVDGHDRFKADMVMKINTILSSKKQTTKTVLDFHGDSHSVVHLKPARKSISYNVAAILDPLSADAQKIVPILMVLVNVTNVDLKIYLNCKDKLSEMPLKRFYRYVLSPELLFDEKGRLLNTASAVFHNMPQTAILTVNMDTPPSWMVEAVNSPYDLDNIHLAEVDNYVYGDFALEYILVEGHCQDSTTSAPPRGLQFILGTKSKPSMFDTIVMANLGYFQLKAYPGSFTLQLRDGRSSEIYQIESMDGSDDQSNEGEFHVTVDSFTGRFLTAKVSRKPDKHNEDLLGGDDKESHGIWDSITSYVNNDKGNVGENGTIHIFSVATGRLYERMLRIMMLTVLKQTKNPVKFWFLKNYLSSTFTSFLPHMSKEYKFEYELVQYQWPSWLHKQTDKQRIIWGYKILFLDVLFPLNVNRVIFVDADQVVRADLKELMEMNLDGAPYAYTPFCDDRSEMDGFRFWKHGYWRSHLGGRPYHISALYVVDLKQFRKLAAGDRLRGQYQGLSQDPNSLANLDQDLPNNMIHQVPIKSLPQEWLWCETWCSDESKKRAKTIDLCNNPKTKEPKLQRATRIVEEWPALDDEIKKLQEKVERNIDMNIAGQIIGESRKDEL